MKCHKSHKLAVLALALALVSCGQPNPQSRSSMKDLAADRNAKNIALIMGAPTDLKGVSTDVAAVSKLFEKPELGFKVIVKNYAAKNDFLIQAAEVAKQLDENSTLFWYYSGHGLQDGGLFAQDQRVVYMKSIIKAMSDVRTVPFKRLIVVLDSCFSGQMVDGRDSIVSSAVESDRLNSAVGLIHGDLQQGVSGFASNAPFEQALVIAAARKNQPSLDAGASVGGLFTAAWRSVLKVQFGDRSNTIRSMIDATVKATARSSNGTHTPVYRAYPASILDEPLMGAGSTSVFDSFIALGSDETRPFIYASVPQGSMVSTAELCQGDVTSCRMASTPKLAHMSLNAVPSLQDRIILSSTTALSLQSGAVYTAVFRDSDGMEKSYKSFRVRDLGN